MLEQVSRLFLCWGCLIVSPTPAHTANLINNVFNKKENTAPSNSANLAAEEDDEFDVETLEYPAEVQANLEMFDAGCKVLGELVGEIRNLLPMEEGHRGGSVVERLLIYGQMRGGGAGSSIGHIGRTLVSLYRLEQEAAEELTSFHSDIEGAIQYDMMRVQDAVVMLEKSRRNVETAAARLRKLKRTAEQGDRKLSQAEITLSGREQAYEMNITAVTMLIPDICKRIDSVFSKGLAGYLRVRQRIFSHGHEIVTSLEDDVNTLEKTVRRHNSTVTVRLQQPQRPADFRHPLLNILASPNFSVASGFSEVMGEVSGEESGEAIAALLCLLDDMEMGVPFLKLTIAQEIQASTSKSIPSFSSFHLFVISAGSAPLFRNGNSAASKLMNACGQMTARSYVDSTIGDMMRAIIQDLQAASRRGAADPDFDFLRDSADALLSAITDSAGSCPWFVVCSSSVFCSEVPLFLYQDSQSALQSHL